MKSKLIQEMQKIDRELFGYTIKETCVMMGCRNKLRFVWKSSIPYSDGKTRYIYTCKKHKDDGNWSGKCTFLKDLKNDQ